MRTIAIIGGKLQGMEAAYLAKKAGIKSILVDRNQNAPAKYLCDVFCCFDVTKKEPELIEILKGVDLLLPANENDELLAATCEIAKEWNLPIAFDQEAYQISSSKIRSDHLFLAHGIPAPRYYPEGAYPYIAKPSAESGSSGVTKICSEEERDRFFAQTGYRPAENTGEDLPGTIVLQEYLQGPSYSIEVIGTPGQYRTYQITQIHMADDYDCCKVTAPCPITTSQKEAFEALAVKLAELVHLHGIMDVEVIDDGGVWKVLEIDARIPSQTPTVVYHSSGLNLVEELFHTFVQRKACEPECLAQLPKYCAFEHILLSKQIGEPVVLNRVGEHVMAEGAPLRLYQDLFFAEEVLTDFDEIAQIELPVSKVFRATFIHVAKTFSELEEMREKTFEQVRKK